MGMYCHFIHFLFNNFKIVHFCYFQNTFPFVSMSRQTDDISKKLPKSVVEQGINFNVIKSEYRYCVVLLHIEMSFKE